MSHYIYTEVSVTGVMFLIVTGFLLLAVYLKYVPEGSCECIIIILCTHYACNHKFVQLYKQVLAITVPYNTVFSGDYNL